MQRQHIICTSSNQVLCPTQTQTSPPPHAFVPHPCSHAPSFVPHPCSLHLEPSMLISISSGIKVWQLQASSCALLHTSMPHLPSQPRTPRDQNMLTNNKRCNLQMMPSTSTPCYLYKATAKATLEMLTHAKDGHIVQISLLCLHPLCNTIWTIGSMRGLTTTDTQHAALIT